MPTDRDRALDLLKQRRPFPKGSPDWNWRTIAAWKYLQQHMGIPVIRWTDTPPTMEK